MHPITFPPYPTATLVEGQPVRPAPDDAGYAAHAAFNLLANALIRSGYQPPVPDAPESWTEPGALMLAVRGLAEGVDGGALARLRREGGTLEVSEAQLAILRATWLEWLPAATLSQAAEVAWMHAALGLTSAPESH